MARILVVDDLAANRELVVTLLRYVGHDMAEAADGEQALAQVRAFKPDLVVCDILMPTMDGYEFVRQLRSEPAIAATEIIFYTATFLEQEAHVLAAACGVRYVLTKPCEPEDILAAVKAALAHDEPLAVPEVTAPDFAREHLRLITDKLAEKADQLEHANARLEEQVDQLRIQADARERDTRLLRLEHSVARALAAADTIDSGLATVIQAVCESQDWDTGRFWKMDDEAGVLRLAMEWFAPCVGRTDTSLPGATVRIPGEGLIGRVWSTREPMWVADLRSDTRMVPGAIRQLPGLLSASMVPLIGGARAFGVLAFLGREVRQPDERMQASVRTIGDQLGQFIQRGLAEEAVKVSEHFLRSTMDSLLEHVCVIDSKGVILTVNRAWSEFARTQSQEPQRVLEGANYLDACANAQGEGAADARVMAAGIRNVINRHQPTFTMEYAFDSPTEARWFMARATRFAGDGPVRVVVAHQNITERKQAERRIRRLHRVATVLSDINALIVRVTARDELFREACRIAIDTGRFKKAWIGILHRNPWRIEVVGSRHDGVASEYLEKLGTALQMHLDTASPQFDQVVVRQQAIVVNDIASSNWMTQRDASLNAADRSAVLLPLVVGAVTRGLIMLFADEVDFFDDEELELLRELAGDLAFAMDHLAQAEQLNRLPTTDALTGHANSMLFNERVAQFVNAATNGGVPLSIGVVDIERFKAINDVWGRHAGDELLRQVASRLLGAVGDRSRMARVGPDQFGVVIQNAPRGIELILALGHLYEGCFGPVFDIGSATIHVGARVGFAMFPEDGHDAETLFRNAEAAVKRAKRSSDRVLLYDARMTEAIAEKIALEMRLREALNLDRFVLYYQPKVDAVTRSIVGVEALIRWQDPELGLVPPFKFIPLMEETGLIVEVGSWALRQAMRDRRGWPSAG